MKRLSIALALGLTLTFSSVALADEYNNDDGGGGGGAYGEALAEVVEQNYPVDWTTTVEAIVEVLESLTFTSGLEYVTP